MYIASLIDGCNFGINWNCAVHVLYIDYLMNKQIEEGVEGVKQFYGESRRFLEVCEKPDVSGKS